MTRLGVALGDFAPWQEEFPTAFSFQIICVGRTHFELIINNTEFGVMFFKNSLLRVFSASAVQSPIPGSQESLKTLEIKRGRNFASP